MRTFPALDVAWPAAPEADAIEHLLAAVDDASPTAVEEQPLGIRIFFATETDRNAAAAIALDAVANATITHLLVPDENWAERSQAALQPIRVGRIAVTPPWAAGEVSDAPIVITIQPSMGFGTGHHASTRLCLALLERHCPPGGAVLDIGTGSGVLAIAAWRLGAATALGIDFDPDALVSAAENVEYNQAGDAVRLAAMDITRDEAALAGRFDLACANITGAMLQRHAAHVAATLARGGLLIASGFQVHERRDVSAAFAAVGLARIDDAEEDTWVAAAFRR